MKYKVIATENLLDLETQVALEIAGGYIPQGGVCCSTYITTHGLGTFIEHNWSQAMIKEQIKCKKK